MNLFIGGNLLRNMAFWGVTAQVAACIEIVVHGATDINILAPILSLVGYGMLLAAVLLYFAANWFSVSCAKSFSNSQVSTSSAYDSGAALGQASLKWRKLPACGCPGHRMPFRYRWQAGCLPHVAISLASRMLTPRGDIAGKQDAYPTSENLH
jgi:hypothetical protein